MKALFCLFLASVGASARLSELLIAGPAAACFAAMVRVRVRVRVKVRVRVRFRVRVRGRVNHGGAHGA